jgi:hypothetical protein
MVIELYLRSHGVGLAVLTARRDKERDRQKDQAQIELGRCVCERLAADWLQGAAAGFACLQQGAAFATPGHTSRVL